MKHFYFTLILLLSVITVSAQADLNVDFGPFEMWGEWEEMDSEHWSLNLPFTITNLSDTYAYDDSVRIEYMPEEYVNNEPVGDSTRIQTEAIKVTLAPGKDTTVIVRLTNIPKLVSLQSVSYYYRKNGEWTEKSIGVFTVPDVVLTSSITGEYAFDSWINDDTNGFCLNMQLTISNSSSTDYTTNIGVNYFPVKKEEIIAEEEQFDSVRAITVPANSSVTVPISIPRLNSSATYYTVEAYLSVDNSWAFLCYRDCYIPFATAETDSLRGHLYGGEWRKDPQTGLTLPFTIALVNPTNHEYADSIWVNNYPIKDDEILWEQGEGYGTLVTVPAGYYEDSVAINVELQEMADTMDSYQIDLLYKVGSEWRYLYVPECRQFPIPSTLTSVNRITAPKDTPLKVYDISGRYVGTMPSDRLSRLQDGVYVVNGRKVLIRRAR